MDLVDVDSKADINKVLENSEDFTHFNRPAILKEETSFLEQIVIDPNEQLGEQ